MNTGNKTTHQHIIQYIENSVHRLNGLPQNTQVLIAIYLKHHVPA